MPGAPLSLPEREDISRALIDSPRVPWAELGRLLDRHPTTIAREVGRLLGRHPTTIAREVGGHAGRSSYRPAVADRAAHDARSRPRPRVLEVAGPLRTRVTGELKLGRSPEAIWADLVADGTESRVCVETIYTAVHAGVLDLKATDCLRTRRRRRRFRQTRHRSVRPALPNIALRPDPVDDRSWPNTALHETPSASASPWRVEVHRQS